MATTNRNKGDYNIIQVFQTPKGFFGIVEGRLTRDATLSKNKNDEDIVSVGVATGEKSNKNRYVSSICRRAGMDIPESVEIENFVNCTIKGKLGEIFSQKGKKGNHVIFAGSISTFNDAVFLYPEFIVLTQWLPGEDGKDHPENQTFGRAPVFTHVKENRQDVFCVVPGVIEYISDIKGGTNSHSGYVYANVSSNESVEKLYDLGINAYQKEKDYNNNKFVVFSSNMVRRDESGELVDTGENRLKRQVKKGTRVLFIGALRRTEDQLEGTVSYKLSVRNFAILSGGVFKKKNEDENANSDTGTQAQTKPAAEPDVPAPENTEGFSSACDDEDELPF